LFLAVLCVLGVSAAPMQRVLFDAGYVATVGTRCLDGSPSGYYIRNASTAASANNWIIFMQGGGACFDQPSCTSRARTVLGSSTAWPTTYTDNSNLCSDDVVANPDFFTWNHVFIPYCGGDVHTGQENVKNQWGLYFAGHLTVAGTLDHLKKTHGLSAASKVLVSGSSAGGIGAFANADFIQLQLPSAVVKTSPQGGWFFPNVSRYDDFLVNKTTLLNGTVSELWHAYYVPACVRGQAPGAGYMCQSIDVSYKYIGTPLFVANNAFDTNQIFAQLGCPTTGPRVESYVEYFGTRMRDSTIKQVQAMQPRKKDGLWLASCLLHTENLRTRGGPVVQGKTYREALGDWFFERSAQPAIYVDQCPDNKPCNPRCNPVPGFPSVTFEANKDDTNLGYFL